MRLEFAQRRKTIVWPLIGVIAVFASYLQPTAVAQTAASAERNDIQAILEKNCFQCHGETLKMANLDLRSRESMLKGGDKGPAVVPGKAAESLPYKRVAGLQQPKMPMAPVPPLSER